MNRFKFQESDVQKVIKHLQSGPSPLSAREDEKQAVVPPGKITANDIGLPKWAHRLKKPAVRKVAHGRLALFEGDLQIVPVERVDEVLRELMLNSESDVPLSRDSGLGSAGAP